MKISPKQYAIAVSKHYNLECFRHAAIDGDQSINEVASLQTNDYRACHQACGQDNSCGVFIWNRQTQACKLYNNLGNANLTGDLLSVMGPRDCSLIENIWPESRNLIKLPDKSSVERFSFNFLCFNLLRKCIVFITLQTKLKELEYI